MSTALDRLPEGQGLGRELAQLKTNLPEREAQPFAASLVPTVLLAN